MPPLLGNVITAYFNEWSVYSKFFEILKLKILAINRMLSSVHFLFFGDRPFKVRGILFQSRKAEKSKDFSFPPLWVGEARNLLTDAQARYESPCSFILVYFHIK